MQALEQLSKACDMAEKAAMGLLKSHVSEYTRQDGTVVQAHEDSRPTYAHFSKKADEASAKAKKTGSHADHAAAAAAHVEAFNHAPSGSMGANNYKDTHNRMYHHHNDRAGEFRE